ncbi:MAG: acyltransferase [Bacteroidia bacterium]|nr:acyltransferase [Bacteroidia bacterium]
MNEATREGKEMPGLNALRFFAAFSVFIGHLELIKYHLGLKNRYDMFERFNFGGIGVYFFFVLSGFLITWLLLQEKKKSGTVAIRAFYMRRILRIWPLYYLILILGFFLLPSIDFFELYPHGFRENFYLDLILYLIVFPNLAFAIAPPVPHIGQAWSIGVEEQFYLLWPVLMKYIRNTGGLIFGLLGCYLLIKGTIWILTPDEPAQWWGVLRRYLAMSKFECMMVGGLGAWIVFRETKCVLSIIFHPIILAVSLVLIPLLSWLLFPYHFLQDVVHLPLSFCFIIVILNVAKNQGSFLKLNNRYLDRLGKISYGFYMYHLMVLFLVVKLFAWSYRENNWWTDAAVVPVAFMTSTAISWISYEYFEKRFIRMKARYSKV